jgi:uncharacterized protein (TIGR00369 family)
MRFDPSEKAEMMARLSQGFTEFIPHNRALDLRFEDFDEGIALLRLPYRADLVGNPETGVLHGGTLTTLLDAASGASVFMKLWKPIPIATLDLRIDYLKPASPGRDVMGKAHCYKLTKNVAFVRAVAYHDDENDPIATSAGTFMVSTKGRPGLGRAVDGDGE